MVYELVLFYYRMDHTGVGATGSVDGVTECSGPCIRFFLPAGY